jgi:hypothetical protein
MMAKEKTILNAREDAQMSAEVPEAPVLAQHVMLYPTRASNPAVGLFLHRQHQRLRVLFIQK